LIRWIFDVFMHGEGLRNLAAALLLSPLALMCGCRSTVGAQPQGTPVAIQVPLGLPPVPLQRENHPTANTIALGRQLFYDNRLSRDNSVSCASCHHPDLAFKDPRGLSIGVAGAKGRRHAPTLVNAAYSTFLFWDGRARSLEAQADGPITDPHEMNQTHEAIAASLRSDPHYKALFQSAFGTDDVTMERIATALAAFERMMLSGNSAFDQYKYQGRKHALSEAQIRGLAIFTDPQRGNCAACHMIGPDYALFTDDDFHNTGEGVGPDGEFTDQGRFEVTKHDSDRGAFKTPTLRNVAVSGPYMHDGKLKTLKDVVDFYAGKGNSNPYLDKRMSAIQLSGRDREDLVEFMKSLTGEMPPGLGSPGEDRNK
jgi:cytochrome c peroxidase